LQLVLATTIIIIMSSEDQTNNPELEKQNAKFGYKAPETVYKKNYGNKASMTAQGQAFQGVSPSTCVSGEVVLLSLTSVHMISTSLRRGWFVCVGAATTVVAVERLFCMSC
jgi:hypothetical protein